MHEPNSLTLFIILILIIYYQEMAPVADRRDQRRMDTGKEPFSLRQS